ncbi:MAG: tetratricopeptide repeat protein [Elusimicrobiota bacterium]
MRIFPTAVLAWALPFAAGMASAQPVVKETEHTQQAVTQTQQVSQTAVQAADQSATEGAGDITYEQILADPDNVDLNYRYAKLQVARGEIRDAAGTLERILIKNPGLAQVRLFYAVVLYRLDILPEARKELAALEGQPMPDSLRAEIREYIKRIEKRQRKTGIQTLFGLGFEQNSNANAAPNGGFKLVGDAPVRLTTGLKEDDQTLVALAHVGFKHDPGWQSGHNFFADFDFYRAEKNELDSLDFEAYSWDFGGTYKTRYGDFFPAAVFTYGQLDNVAYLRTRGGRLGYERKLTNRLGVFASFGGQFQEFIVSHAAPTADERTGNQTDLGWGVNYLLNPKMRVTFKHDHSDKDSRVRYTAYKRDALQVSHAWLLAKGTFLLSSLTGSFDRYDMAELAVSRSDRIDNTARISFTYGAPLGVVSPALKDLLWTLTYEFFNSDSTVISYDYNNHKLSTMFIYKWDY